MFMSVSILKKIFQTQAWKKTRQFKKLDFALVLNCYRYNRSEEVSSINDKVIHEKKENIFKNKKIKYKLQKCREKLELMIYRFFHQKQDDKIQ